MLLFALVLKGKRKERPSPRWAFLECGSRQREALPFPPQLSAPERADAQNPPSFVHRPASIVLNDALPRPPPIGAAGASFVCRRWRLSLPPQRAQNPIANY